MCTFFVAVSDCEANAAIGCPRVVRIRGSDYSYGIAHGMELRH